jgi:hypothetical protein
MFQPISMGGVHEGPVPRASPRAVQVTRSVDVITGIDWPPVVVAYA